MAIATGTALAIGGAAVLGAGASAYAGNRQASAAQDAARYQSETAGQAMQLGAGQYQQTRQDLAPYRQAGTEALDMYRNMVLGGDTSQFQASPGYQFRLGEGVNALEQGAAARGGLLSGQQQKALTQYGQGIGSDEYQNYLNQVYNLSQQGVGAATQTGQFGMANTQSTNQALMQVATARNAGIPYAGGAAQGVAENIGLGLGTYAGLKS